MGSYSGTYQGTEITTGQRPSDNSHVIVREEDVMAGREGVGLFWTEIVLRELSLNCWNFESFFIA